MATYHPTQDISEWESIVRQRTGISTDEEAGHVLDAVIDAFGERLTGDEATTLAAHLPPRLGELLLYASKRLAGETDLSGFVAAIAWRENISRAEALEHALTVCEVVEAALPPDALAKLRADLPPSLSNLLQQAPQLGLLGRARPASSYQPDEARPHLSTAQPEHIATASPQHRSLSEARPPKPVCDAKPR